MSGDRLPGADPFRPPRARLRHARHPRQRPGIARHRRALRDVGGQAGGRELCTGDSRIAPRADPDVMNDRVRFVGSVPPCLPYRPQVDNRTQ